MSEMDQDEKQCVTVDRGRVEAPPTTASPECGIPSTEGSSTEFSRETFLGLLRTGLRPNSAVAYLGVSRDRWQEILAADPTLRTDIAKAVAAFEIIHVRNLHQRIQETTDWRAIAWWLAQRFPKRYGGGRGSQDAAKAIDEVLTVLDEALRGEFTSPAELERVGKVLSRLERARGT